MSITKIHAREILDSRGNPTVEVDLWTAKGEAWDTQNAHACAHTLQTLIILVSQVSSEQQSPVERPQVSMKLLNSAMETRAATWAKVNDKLEICKSWNHKGAKLLFLNKVLYGSVLLQEQSRLWTMSIKTSHPN